MTQEQQWEPIKYVASNKNVQDLLTLLYDHGSATYDQIKHLANNYVIEQLDKFNLITYNQSRAYGLTKDSVIKESTYQLSTKGTNWYRLIMNLATLSNDTVIVQLSIGDFKKFITHLTNFMYSEDPENIKDAYEFLLDDTTGNFYQRCDAKLNHLRDSANRLQAELITIQSEASIAKTIDHLSAHINEFSNVAKDILETLLQDGKLIEQRLDELKTLEHSKFYKDIAQHIEGVTADETTAERIKNNVTRYNLYTNFNYDSNYDGTIFTIDLDTNWNQTKINDFLYLLDYTYYLEIDNGYDFMSVEHEAFDRAYLENDFSEDNPKEPQTQYHAALRKRWFIEYFKRNLFLGFQLKNIKSFDFTID